jgi:hypothetical protein
MHVESLIRRLSSSVTAVAELHHSHNSHWVIRGYLREVRELSYRRTLELPEVVVVSEAPPFYEAEGVLEEVTREYLEMCLRRS